MTVTKEQLYYELCECMDRGYVPSKIEIEFLRTYEEENCKDDNILEPPPEEINIAPF